MRCRIEVVSCRKTYKNQQLVLQKLSNEKKKRTLKSLVIHVTTSSKATFVEKTVFVTFINKKIAPIRKLLKCCSLTELQLLSVLITQWVLGLAPTYLKDWETCHAKLAIINKRNTFFNAFCFVEHSQFLRLCNCFSVVLVTLSIFHFAFSIA